jgi:hypothetical protein
MGNTAPPSLEFDIAHHESAASLWITKQPALQRPPESDAILVRVITKARSRTIGPALAPQAPGFLRAVGRRAPAAANETRHASHTRGPALVRLGQRLLRWALKRRDQSRRQISISNINPHMKAAAYAASDCIFRRLNPARKQIIKTATNEAPTAYIVSRVVYS